MSGGRLPSVKFVSSPKESLKNETEKRNFEEIKMDITGKKPPKSQGSDKSDVQSSVQDNGKY
jgi:hypothetical protein